jgi:hypothetical protein
MWYTLKDFHPTMATNLLDLMIMIISFKIKSAIVKF